MIDSYDEFYNHFQSTHDTTAFHPLNLPTLLKDPFNHFWRILFSHRRYNDDAHWTNVSPF